MVPSTTVRCLIYKLVLIVPFFILNLAGIDGSSESEKKTLYAHNKYRRMHRVDSLELSEEMNKKAMQCAKYYHAKDDIDHSCPHKKTDSNAFGVLGENLYISWGDQKSPDNAVAMKAVDGWYVEVKDWDFAKGQASKEGAVVGHFTQLVWKSSKLLGVGIYRGGETAVVVALYDPPGNIKKKYPANVFPEDKSKRGESAGGREDENKIDSGTKGATEDKHHGGHHGKHGKSSRLQVSWNNIVYLLLALYVTVNYYPN